MTSLTNDTTTLNPCPICQQPSTKTCSGCSSISYCSAQHQHQHWPHHKAHCRPFVVKRNDLYGRYLVAARDLPQGTIVLTESPLVVGPKRSTNPICLSCHHRVNGSYHCSKCTYPMCNELCEKNPAHANQECPIFQKGHPIGSRITQFDQLHPAYEAITVLRCLLLKNTDKDKWTKLNTMEHLNTVRQTFHTLWNRNEHNTVKLIKQWWGCDYDSETIHSVMGYIDVNCFEIKYKDVEICGVYPEASLMSHDCCPNTHHATTGSPTYQMIVRTSVAVKKGDILSTSYADCFKPTIQRRIFLKDTKYFDCYCQRCQDPKELGSYICAVNCECGGYLLPAKPTDSSELWVCDKCTANVKYTKITQIQEKCSKEISGLTKVSKLEQILKKFSGKVLHPNHYLLIGVVRQLIKLYTDTDEKTLKRKVELCKHLIKIYELIDPGLNRDKAVTLFHLYKAELPLIKIMLDRGDVNRNEFEQRGKEILVQLATAKATLELDKFILDEPVLALAVDAAIDSVYETMIDV